MTHGRLVVVVPPKEASFGSTSLVRSLADALKRRNIPIGCRFLNEDEPERPSLALVLVSPLVADVGQAAAGLDRVSAMGLSADRTWPVLIHDGLPGGLSSDAVRGAFKQPLHVLPYDPDCAVGADNNDVLFREHSSRSGLTRALERLADEMAEFLRRPDPGTVLSVTVDALINRVAAALWRRWRGATDAGPAGMTLEREVDMELDRCAAGLGQLTGPVRAEAREKILAHLTGLGPLEHLLTDGSVNDILVNGTGPVFVEREGRLVPAGVSFESDEQLRTVIDRVVGRAGRRVDLASPLCDVRWQDGSRVNVAVPPVALSGASLTIRRFRAGYESLEALVGAGTMTPAQAERLSRAVAERDNLIVAGNTGAGKTTLLNVLAGLAASSERIITLEDAAELRIQGPQVVRLETRPPNTEGTGEITMSALLVNALRMRPDRIVVGECRGAEAVPMLQAMNTGHDGGMTTLHANSSADALERLEAMVLLGAPQWPAEVVRRQIASAIDLILYLKRDSSGRKLTDIGRIRVEKGQLRLESDPQ